MHGDYSNLCTLGVLVFRLDAATELYRIITKHWFVFNEFRQECIWLGFLLLILAFASFTYSHGNFYRATFKPEVLSQSVNDEPSIPWIKKTGGKQNKFWWTDR